VISGCGGCGSNCGTYGGRFGKPLIIDDIELPVTISVASAFLPMMGGSDCAAEKCRYCLYYAKGREEIIINISQPQ